MTTRQEFASQAMQAIIQQSNKGHFSNLTFGANWEQKGHFSNIAMAIFMLADEMIKVSNMTVEEFESSKKLIR